jgi:hypothetical protein
MQTSEWSLDMQGSISIFVKEHQMSNLYQWSVWLHVLAAFVFFFSHGAEMATAFMLPKEKNANGMKALLNITQITLIPFGVTAGWWKKGWWELSFLIMVCMLAWMSWYARKYYSPIRKALGVEYMTGFGTHNPPEGPESMDVVYALVAKTNPRLLAWAGLTFTAVLLFLMRFKPF